LRRLGANAHRHHVTADWSTITFAALTSFEGLIIEFGTVATKDRFNRTRNCALLLLLTLGLILLARLVLLARLALLCVLALLLATTAAATASTASTPTVPAAGLTAALAFGLGRVSIGSVVRISCWSGSTVADLGPLHRSLVRSSRLSWTILRGSLRQSIGLTFEIGSAGLVGVIAGRRIRAATLTSARTIAIATTPRTAPTTRAIGAITGRRAVTG